MLVSAKTKNRAFGQSFSPSRGRWSCGSCTNLDVNQGVNNLLQHDDEAARAAAASATTSSTASGSSSVPLVASGGSLVGGGEATSPPQTRTISRLPQSADPPAQTPSRLPPPRVEQQHISIIIPHPRRPLPSTPTCRAATTSSSRCSTWIYFSEFIKKYVCVSPFSNFKRCYGMYFE